MDVITYEALFAFLKKHGFQDVSTNRFERIFEQPAHGILSAFSIHRDGKEDQIVRDADLLSVEIQFQQNGLLDTNLSEVLKERVPDF